MQIYLLVLVFTFGLLQFTKFNITLRSIISEEFFNWLIFPLKVVENSRETPICEAILLPSEASCYIIIIRSTFPIFTDAFEITARYEYTDNAYTWLYLWANYCSDTFWQNRGNRRRSIEFYSSIYSEEAFLVFEPLLKISFYKRFGFMFLNTTLKKKIRILESFLVKHSQTKINTQ